MNACATKAKKHPLVAALQGPAGLIHNVESIMTEKQSIWQQANQQANHISKLKNKKAKSRQVVLLCETLKRALKGEK